MGQRVTIEPTEEMPGRRPRGQPREVHAATLVPYVDGWEPAELVYDDEYEDRELATRARRRRVVVPAPAGLPPT